MFRQKKIGIGIIMALIIGVGFYYFKIETREKEYVTEIVNLGDIKKTISVTGKVVSPKKVDLAFEINGKISSVYVSTGDKIEKGQIIAKLDDRILRKQFVQAREERNIAQENLDLARRDWDDLKPEEKEAKKAAVRSAQAAVDISGVNLAKTRLISPINGIVTKIDIKAGETVTANLAVVSVDGDNDLEIEANVPESDIARIKVGQKAEVTLDAFESDKIYKADVFQIEPAATIIQDVVYYKVKFKIKEGDIWVLKAGMSADLDIFIDGKINVMVIPSRAIKIENGKEFVEVLRDDKRVEKKFVKTGLEGDGGITEIISGLSEGDKIIVFTKEK